MPTIDLAFTVRGTTIPLDYGYALFWAICRVVPASTATAGSASTRSAGCTCNPAG